MCPDVDTSCDCRLTVLKQKFAVVDQKKMIVERDELAAGTQASFCATQSRCAQLAYPRSPTACLHIVISEQGPIRPPMAHFRGEG